MKLPYILGVLSIIGLSACTHKTQNKEDYKQELTSKIKTNAEESFFIDVIMKKDTLNNGKHKGIIEVFRKTEDTLKVSLKDSRRISFFIGVVGIHNKPIKKDIEFKLMNTLNDTIYIPFEMKLHPLGKSNITLLVTDVYSLYSYSSKGMIRMIENTSVLKKVI